MKGGKDDQDAVKLAECRATNPPLLWAKNCRGLTQKIGCAAVPGGSAPGHGWWALLALAALRRRIRG